MAQNLSDNLKYNGTKPDFVRQQYDTLAAMKAVRDVSMPEMYLAFCLEDRTVYKFDKTATVDTVTGKWRPLISGGSEPQSIAASEIDALFE